MDWFRVYAEMIDDPKVGRLSDSQFRTFMGLLCLACRAERSGNTACNVTETNWVLRRDVSSDIEALMVEGIIGLCDDQTIFIINWEKRQKKSDNSTSRVQKHRREKARIDDQGSGNGFTGDSETSVTVSETGVKRYRNGLEERREEQNSPLPPEGDGGDAPSSPRTEYSAEFEAAWSAYPRRAGSNSKREAYRCWCTRLKEGTTPAELEAAVRRYLAFCEATGKIGTEKVQQGARFFGPNEQWCQDWSLPVPAAPSSAAPPSAAVFITPPVFRPEDEELHALRDRVCGALVRSGRYNPGSAQAMVENLTPDELRQEWNRYAS